MPPQPSAQEGVTAGAVLAFLTGAASPVRPLRRGAIATGFEPLDGELASGLHPGSLVLLGGVPGVGKTIAALQWAAHMAAAGSNVVYVCYEHDEVELLVRLLLQEAGGLAHADNAPAMDKLRASLRDVANGQRDLRAMLDSEPILRVAGDRLAAYGNRLRLIPASGRIHGLEEIDALVDLRGDAADVLVIDYLQKVAVHAEPSDEPAKVSAVAEGLKDIAMRRDIPVLAIVASDMAGVDGRRLRLHHLRGSSALAYESDTVILMNDKHRIVSKSHLSFDPLAAERSRHAVIFSIEKNRAGPAGVDVEHRKDFPNYRFDPLGGFVAERLVDDRLTEE